VIATLLLGLTTLAMPQAPPVTDAALLKSAFEKATQCGDATVKGDLETLADLTHPAILKGMGGREAMIKAVRTGMGKMKDDGFQLESMKAEPPKILSHSGSSLYCIVPMTVSMKAPGNRITAKGFLLGVSGDDGATWTFLDGAKGEKPLRTILPEIPQDLKFPSPQKPKIEKIETDN
jgi:hypothetical protein